MRPGAPLCGQSVTTAGTASATSDGSPRRRHNAGQEFPHGHACVSSVLIHRGPQSQMVSGERQSCRRGAARRRSDPTTIHPIAMTTADPPCPATATTGAPSARRRARRSRRHAAGRGRRGEHTGALCRRARDRPRRRWPSWRRLHHRRGAHEPAGRPPPQRRRAGELHGHGLPGPARRQREQRGRVRVPRHVHPRRAPLRRCAAGQRLPPTRVDRGADRRARRSRRSCRLLPLWHRALVGGRLRPPGRSWLSCWWRSWPCWWCCGAGVPRHGAGSARALAGTPVSGTGITPGSGGGRVALAAAGTRRGGLAPPVGFGRGASGPAASARCSSCCRRHARTRYQAPASRKGTANPK